MTKHFTRAAGERQRRGVRPGVDQQEWTAGSRQREEARRPLPCVERGTSVYLSSASRGCLTPLRDISRGLSDPEKHLN